MSSIYKNISLLKIDAFFNGLWILNPFAIIYFEQITHSYALSMLIWSISSLTQTLTEIPAGLISDRIGRRKTLICASFCIFFCFLLWAIAGNIQSSFLLFLGAILWGISDSFLSGTNEALIFETMEELGKKNDFDLLYSKTNFWGQCGLALSALLAMFLSFYCSIHTIAWISVFPMMGQIITAFLLVEPVRTKKQKLCTSWNQFMNALKTLIHNRRLTFYSFVTIIDESITNGFNRMEAAYYQSVVNEWCISFCRLLKQISGMIGFSLIKYLKRINSVNTFFGSVGLSAILSMIGIILNNFISPFIMSITNLFWGTSLTARTNILQQEFSPNMRATMQSIIEFIKGIAMALIMFVFGILADISSPKIVIVLIILIKALMVILSLTVFKKYAEE